MALLDITVSHLLCGAKAAAVGEKRILAPFNASILDPSGKSCPNRSGCQSVQLGLKTRNPWFPEEKVRFLLPKRI